MLGWLAQNNYGFDKAVSYLELYEAPDEDERS